MITGLEFILAAQLGLSTFASDNSSSPLQQAVYAPSRGQSPHIEKVIDIIECEAQDMTKINVIWATDEINYDHSKTMEQLSNMPIDTKSPYAAHVLTKVGGLMKGGLEVTTNYKIAQARYDIIRKNCLWMSEIDISIKINPTIFIARDYKEGSCMYNSVKTHEMKHIQVDRDIATKYQHFLRDMASKVAQKVGVVGPKSDFEARRTEEKIKEYFSQNMNVVLEKMYEERRQHQQLVDNLDEYEAVHNSCKGQR